MPSINWDETVPQDTESAGLGDDRIRSLKSSVRVGLDGEHIWPSGGGEAGVHRLGSARPYYGTQSLVSSSGTDGRLMVTSDSSRLFHVGSAGTMFLGGATVLSVGSEPVGGQRFYWALECGEVNLATGSVNVSFPNSGFSGKPFVQVSVNTNGVTTPTVAVFTNLTATNMTVRALTSAGIVTHSGTSICWESIGTRTF